MKQSEVRIDPFVISAFLGFSGYVANQHVRESGEQLTGQPGMCERNIIFLTLHVATLHMIFSKAGNRVIFCIVTLYLPRP